MSEPQLQLQDNSDWHLNNVRNPAQVLCGLDVVGKRIALGSRNVPQGAPICPGCIMQER